MESLSEKRLSLSPAIESRTLPDGTRVLKQCVRREYLALDSHQLDQLQHFDGARTVEEILHACLRDGGQTSIHAFYDLILTAMDRGFLREGGPGNQVDFEPAGQTVNPFFSLAISIAFLVLGGVAFANTSIVPALAVTEWLQIALFASLGVSLGCLLAADALTTFGREVTRVRLRFDRILPFLHADTRDAFMGGRGCEIAVALRGLAAPFLLAALAWLIGAPYALLGAAIAAFVVASPFGDTPAHMLLHAVLRKEYRLPRCAERFLNGKLFSQMFNWKQKLKEENYLLVYSTYAILWMAGLFWFANLLLRAHADFLPYAQDRIIPPEAIPLLRVILAGLALVIAAVLISFVWVIGSGIHRMLAPHLFPAEPRVSRKGRSTHPPSEKEMLDFLAGTLLFSQVSREEIQQLAAAFKYSEVEEGTMLIRERDPGDSMFVIYRGSVEVLKEDEAGHQRRIAQLGAGEVFGEIALIDKVPRTSSVRSTENTAVLILSKSDFDQLLVSTLGVDRIKETVQISAFLQRNSLFADWHRNALTNLAHKFAFEEFIAGQTVIRQHEPNESFYLVYEGRFNVQKDGETLTTLHPGNFCGEISLLRNTPATADVTALTYGRCLRLSKEDFLKFISHDFVTGMAIERTVKDRIRRRAA